MGHEAPGKTQMFGSEVEGKERGRVTTNEGTLSYGQFPVATRGQHS